MEKYITDERTGLQYELVGDYHLIAGDDELCEEQKPIGIWGKRHHEYLRHNKRITVSNLQISGKLNDYLADIDRQAEKMFERLIKQMAAAGGHNRATESHRPNGMGRQDEQYTKSGNRNHKHGNNKMKCILGRLYCLMQSPYLLLIKISLYRSMRFSLVILLNALGDGEYKICTL